MSEIDRRPPAVKADNLTKKYRDFLAVDAISFHINHQECFGFLGPNGAGKTSTVRMMYGFSPVTAGSLEVLGLDVTQRSREVKARLGVVPQEDNLDPELSVLENLLVYASYFGMPKREAGLRARELLTFIELSEKADTPVERLSGGMQRRLTIARALINRPELLLLDEPTTGLDPQARRLIWQRLRQLKSEGVTMVLTTHYMEEAQQLCDRLVVMDEGRILDEGAPSELIARYVGREVLDFHNQQLRAATLEDVFLKLTGKGLNGDGR